MHKKKIIIAYNSGVPNPDIANDIVQFNEIALEEI